MDNNTEKIISYDDIKKWISHDYLSPDEIHKLGVLNNHSKYLLYDNNSVLEE